MNGEGPVGRDDMGQKSESGGPNFLMLRESSARNVATRANQNANRA
jgi:hypothetical protein